MTRAREVINVNLVKSLPLRDIGRGMFNRLKKYTKIMCEIHEITLWFDNKEIKTFNGVLFENDTNYQSVKENVSRWFKLTHNVHYNKIKTKFIQMAIKRQAIEEATILEETTNGITETPETEFTEVETEEIKDTEFNATLPSIPETFIVNGKEHSLAKVSEMKTKADGFEKQATPKSYTDKKLWESINSLRIEAKDQRTKLESQRKNLVKPINDKLSELKSKTDEIGSQAKTVEERLQKLIDTKNNWEQEQEKIRLAELAKRTESRKDKIRELAGKLNIENEMFTFDYDPILFINFNQIETLTDEDFESEYKYILKSYNEEQDRIKKEQEEAEALIAKAKENKNQLVEMREIILTSADFVKSETGWSKNNFHNFNFKEIEDLPNTEFMRLAMSELPVTTIPKTKELPKGMVEVDVQKDPLHGVISGMVGKHIEHQEKVDSVKRIELVFTKEEPYIALAMGKTTLFLTSIEYEDAMLANVNADSEVLAKAVHGDLIISAIRKSKK